MTSPNLMNYDLQLLLLIVMIFILFYFNFLQLLSVGRESVIPFLLEFRQEKLPEIMCLVFCIVHDTVGTCGILFSCVVMSCAEIGMSYLQAKLR